MKFRPSSRLTEQQVQSGLKLVTGDGIAAEAMATLTGGTFLVAMAVSMGASNVQIGLLAALPTFVNVSQLLAIWLVQRFNNRRAIAVVCSFFARFPLLVIGLLPFVFSAGTSLTVLLFLLFFHYLFGAVSGASWNSWMKDLVPQNILGTYFSQRTRITQMVNLVLSLVLALTLDYAKKHFPQYEMTIYSIMFVIGGVLGMIGIYLMARTPEPRHAGMHENVFRLISKPLKHKNFRKLLVFNSFWAFALNLATPFFAIYMMKTIGLSLSYIIGLSMLSQLASIAFVKTWGVYSDRYSNKTIIRFCAPIYVFCILAWAFVPASSTHMLTLPLLIFIHILMGLSTAGINLSITNIALKLAPAEDAIAFIAARNMIVALVPALAPVAGGLLADFLVNRQFAWHALSFQHWDFFFVAGSLLAICSLRFLKNVREEGEVRRDVFVYKMVSNARSRFTQWRKRKALSYVNDSHRLPNKENL
jgi:MFS family permease